MSSLMLTETLEAPLAVEHLLAAAPDAWAELGARLRALDPRAVVTVARGSSDHAAAYLGYLVAARVGRPAASLPMSLVTLYRARLAVRGFAAFAISQSGQSPDLVETLAALRAAGALTVAFVNDTASPLAAAAEWCLGLSAGAERSVAATKSFIASLAAAARIVGLWQKDAAFLARLAALPDQLARAARSDWTPALPALAPAGRAIVVGRGLGLAIASEAALKLKEICGLHAEAFSGAELRHGPIALVGPAEPVLVLAPEGPALGDLVGLAAELRARGGAVLLAAPERIAERDLTLPATGDPDLDPIAAVQAFYPFAHALALARGRDPDRPSNLAKVTRTV